MLQCCSDESYDWDSHILWTATLQMTPGLKGLLVATDTSVDVRCVLGVLSSHLNVNTMPSVFLVIAFSTVAD